MDLKLKLNASGLQRPSPVVTNRPPPPVSFDSRDKWSGLITGPLNQGECGSCWSFATCTSASDRIRIANPHETDFLRKIKYYDSQANEYYYELNSFSPWVLASCNLCEGHPLAAEIEKYEFCQTSACKGNILQLAMQYITINGMITAECDPRHTECLQDKTKCDYQCYIPKQCKLYKPKYVHQDGSDAYEAVSYERMETIQYSILQDGPVVGGFTVYESFKDFFSDPMNAKRVYSRESRKKYPDDQVVGGHAICIVGWGVSSGEGGGSSTGTKLRYWLCRNSWGSDWGDEGFFRIERGVNFCDIAADVWSSHW